jgi:hypothetical protein
MTENSKLHGGFNCALSSLTQPFKYRAIRAGINVTKVHATCPPNFSIIPTAATQAKRSLARRRFLAGHGSPAY